TDHEYHIKAELPGIKKEDLKVTFENGLLTIKGERKQEKEEKDKKFHRIERYYGSFARSFSIPDNVDETKLKAEFKEGLLNIYLPKTQKPKSKSTEIALS
ncbi:MAG: heat-shock protein, partial [Gammaproteobacteria bacterium]|nr:heat-shock protein [Gammaproteobacteria bacterium]